MRTMQMEIVHYNKSTAEVGEVICERANDLQADAVVMARYTASLLLLRPETAIAGFINPSIICNGQTLSIHC